MLYNKAFDHRLQHVSSPIRTQLGSSFKAAKTSRGLDCFVFDDDGFVFDHRNGVTFKVLWIWAHEGSYARGIQAKLLLQ
jgi:hypothetical protein